LLVYTKCQQNLGLFGIAHIVFLWEGDILLLYSLVGFPLLLFRRTTPRNLVRLILALLIVPSILVVIVFSVIETARVVPAYSAQINLAEAEVIARQAQEELLEYFPDWTIKTEAVSGSPASLILSRAFEFKPDFVVVGAQGLSSDRQIGLGSVSQKILTEAKCSVRIARVKPDAAHSRLKIMIGFDDSPGSMAAVKTVAARQWRGKPEIRLVTVTDPFFPLIPGRVLRPIPGLSEGKMKGEQKWAKMLAAKALKMLHNAGLSATLDIYDGNPRMILIQEAEKWEADLIFIGANSIQSQSRQYSLGCVASAIASRVSCSVEVVRQN